MRKKGFTLIELLTVIIILGVIALITIPLVVRLIRNARRDSSVESANSYVKSVKSAILANSKRVGLKDVTCTINENGTTATCNNEIIDIDVEGKKPRCGTIKFENFVLKSYIMNVGGYRIVKTGEDDEEAVTKSDNC